MARRKRQSGRESKEERATGKISIKRMRTKNILSEEEAEIEFEAEIFETEPAYIRVSHGVTKSIGDFESLRVDVAITLPCYKETIEDLVDDLGDRVGLMLERELDEYGINLHGDNK